MFSDNWGNCWKPLCARLFLFFSLQLSSVSVSCHCFFIFLCLTLFLLFFARLLSSALSYFTPPWSRSFSMQSFPPLVCTSIFSLHSLEITFMSHQFIYSISVFSLRLPTSPDPSGSSSHSPPLVFLSVFYPRFYSNSGWQEPCYNSPYRWK